MAEVFGISLPILLLLIGVILGIGEAIAPGAHLIVLGVALIAAGLLGLALSPIALGSALLTAIMALAVLLTGGVALFLYRELDIYGGKGMDRTKDSASLRGSSGRVTQRVTPTEGQVKLEGGGFNPYYQARTLSGEIPVGKEVIVLDPGGGNVLRVEALDGLEDDIDRELARGRQRDSEDPSTEVEREST